MKKVNRKIHNAYCRYRFWYSLTEHFIGFKDLLQADNYLTYEDRQTLHEIHSSLFRCYELAKEKKEALIGA